MDVMPKAMQSIRTEMRKGRGEHLSVPQFRVLAAVNRGLQHNKEIGNLLGVSEAAISRMVDLLVKDRLIRKGINKLDRRLSLLSLTSEGAKFFNTAQHEARISLKERLDILSSEDALVVIKGLEILQSHAFLWENE
jgi:DNA-binding MarR family transcriptional regulator